MRRFCYNILILIFVLLYSCKTEKNSKTEIVEIDFSESFQPDKNIRIHDSIPTLNVAVSAIISPRETFAYYNELFEYISKKIGYQINFKQRKTYQEVNDMLFNGEVDMAFICSGAYIEEKKRSGIEILAVPVCNGKPMYQAYVITHKASGVKRLEDLRGKNFAYTDPLSNSGRLYVIGRMKDFGTSDDNFFSSIIFSYGHDISIQLVAKELVDGATVDGLIYEYITTHNPEQTKNTTIVEKSEEYGIPPIVIPKNLDRELKQKLEDTFFSIHQDSVGKRILEKLLIEKFIAGDDSNYDGIRKLIWEKK